MNATPRLATVAVLILSPLANAAGPEAGSLRADLDADGNLETISWSRFAQTEDEGDFYQLLVSDAAGKILWEGPKATDTENPLVFGSWHFGVTLPEMAADIDGDGAVELVAPEPQSDVSPTWFRVLRWKAGRFVPARIGTLLESPPGSKSFPWSRSEQNEGTWISEFTKANPDGSLQVGVFQYAGGTAAKSGEAIVFGNPKGFRILKWISPLKTLDDEAPGPPSGAPVYRARLGKRDHFNSAGKRLESVGAVLRQDRANFHNGNGDPEDEPDSMFRTAAERYGMDARKPVPVGTTPGPWRKAILGGTPLVEVEATANELKVRILKP